MNSNIYSSFPDEYSTKLKNFFDKKFCILGCGAVGASVAELLIRSGSKNLSLIDRDVVKKKNIHNNFQFRSTDIQKSKVSVLKKNLISIKQNINIETIEAYYTPSSHTEEDPGGVGTTLLNSDVIICCIDKSIGRFECSNLCQKKIFVTTGIEVLKENFKSSIHAVWIPPGDTLESLYERPQTDEQGYGPGNYSYSLIILECAISLLNVMIRGFIFNEKAFSVSRTYKHLTLLKEETKNCSDSLILKLPNS